MDMRAAIDKVITLLPPLRAVWRGIEIARGPAEAAAAAAAAGPF